MDHLSINDKKAHGLLAKRHQRIVETRECVSRSQILQSSQPGYLECEGLERTWKVKQKDLSEQVPVVSANKIFELRLSDGPYMIDYSRNGRSLLIGGQSGHISAFNWRTGKLSCELWVKERIRGVKWLHNESFFAVSQSKYVYIYDSNGIEIHVLRHHQQAVCLEFLPYHLLLVSVGKSGILRYQDVSTGESVAEINTKYGTPSSMRQNPTNAVIHSGHVNGTICLWCPTMSSPLVRMLCHRGPVAAISVDRTGTYMATAGLDGQIRAWDLRNYKLLESYFSPLAATSLDISQLGLLSVGYGSNITIWKDAFLTKQTSPYMSHLVPNGSMQSVRFCPFDDTLGIGHSLGFSSILVPGSGEPNFDSFETNPFEIKRQSKESEVKMILEKISPDSIYLNDEHIGSLKSTPKDSKSSLQTSRTKQRHDILGRFK